MTYPGTLFIDIDGTLVEYTNCMSDDINGTTINMDGRDITCYPKLLKGAREFVEKYTLLGYKIIITTGRKESCRLQTEEMLRNYKIYYDMLIMGLPRGPRIVVNDIKPDYSEEMCKAIAVERNKGLKEFLEEL